MVPNTGLHPALNDNYPTDHCPYFSLPSAKFLVPVTRISKLLKGKNKVSIVDLWGKGDEMTEATTTAFLLSLLKHARWNVDYDAVSREWGVKPIASIHKRLRKIVEDEGLVLNDKLQVVEKGKEKEQPSPQQGVKRKATTNVQRGKNKAEQARTTAVKKEPASEEVEVDDYDRDYKLVASDGDE